jgi:HEAT repeat protein
MTIEQLVQELQNPDEQRRHEALRRLRVRGGPEAVAALIGALDHPSENIRVDAALKLGEMEAPEAVSTLIDRLKSDTSGPERALYADVLCQIGDPRAFQPLVDALNDLDEHVAKEACSSLMMLEDPRAIDPLLKTLDHLSWLVRYSACLALGEFGVTDERIIRALEKLVEDLQSENDPLRRAAWERMKWELERQQGSMDGVSRQDSEKELEKAFESAVTELQDPNPNVRSRGVGRLQRLGGSRAVEALIGAMDDLEQGIRSGAAMALMDLEALEAVPVLIEHLLQDQSHRVQSVCAVCLGRFKDERAVHGLMQALGDPEPSVLELASASLGTIGDDRAVQSLLPLLDHPQWKVRANAAWALIRLKASEERLVSALEQLAREPEAEEHDLEADEWNCNLERHRRLAREVGEPEPSPMLKMGEMIAQARRLLARVGS